MHQVQVFQRIRHHGMTPAQLSKMVEFTALVRDIYRNMDQIVKRKQEDNNVDFVTLVILLEMKQFVSSIVNMYFFVKDDPKRCKKFVSALAQTSTKKFQKILATIEKNKKRIADMSEADSETYAEQLKAPLSEYLHSKSRKLDTIVDIVGIANNAH